MPQRPPPIPVSQLHYADPAHNDEAQSAPIRPFIDLLHYPTLGCPALLGPGQALDILLSLSEHADPSTLEISAVNRHGGGATFPLTPLAKASDLGLGPEGKTGRRRLFQLTLDLNALPPALYDVSVRTEGRTETQANALRVYPAISGDEQVIFCGDSQFHLANAVCLERFVERMNARQDVAWIALIGDVCDNNVEGTMHMLKLAATATPGPVTTHYTEEYARSHAILARLNKPILLSVGNHDGMAANEGYAPGVATSVVTGPDANNAVVYDGLHHFRRTFGPLYYGLDWGNTRYLAACSFELDRHYRLGYHAVVVNWGGFVQQTQLDWMTAELASAKAQHKDSVLLIHHDPRGGSLGKDLGYYSMARICELPSLRSFALDYARYLRQNGRRRWQQEWMREPLVDLADNPARRLLSAVCESGTFAVIMGHDNENWVESYLPGDDIFQPDYTFFGGPNVVHYAAHGAVPGAETVLAVRDLLGDDDLEGALARLEKLPPQDAERALAAAIEKLEAEGHFDPTLSYAPDEVRSWNLRARAPLHFIHVDDVGAYDHDKESDFADYGFVVTQLEGGKPVRLQRFDLARLKAGPVVDLTEV